MLRGGCCFPYFSGQLDLHATSMTVFFNAQTMLPGFSDMLSDVPITAKARG